MTGPLGAPVEAEWRLLEPTRRRTATAVIEMARAAGRALLPAPARRRPGAAPPPPASGSWSWPRATPAPAASSSAAAARPPPTVAGARSRPSARRRGPAAASSWWWPATSRTAFRRRGRGVRPAEGRHPRAGRRCSPGASTASRRATARDGVDVDAIPGAGAAGGLAGGLAALGAGIGPVSTSSPTLIGLRGGWAGRPRDDR